MNIFGDLFDFLDPGPRDRLREMEMMYGKAQIKNPYANASIVDGDTLEAATRTSKFVEFHCYNCKAKLSTSKEATHCECPNCHFNNELYQVSEPIGRIDTWFTKAKPPTYQHGRTTDNDDIIDIAYEVLPPDGK